MQLDKIDRKLLGELQRDARMTNSALAQRVGLSESACLRRVRNLEAAGVIEGYGARLNSERVGLSLSLLVRIALKSQTDKDLGSFEDAVRAVPQVIECFLTTGESDYLLRAVARDAADLERLHSKVFTKLPGVARVETSLALRQVVRAGNLPLG